MHGFIFSSFQAYSLFYICSCYIMQCLCSKINQSSHRTDGERRPNKRPTKRTTAEKRKRFRRYINQITNYLNSLVLLGDSKYLVDHIRRHLHQLTDAPSYSYRPRFLWQSNSFYWDSG